MPGAKPETATDVVCSFPHSGTRTLQRWLEKNRPELPQPISHWHFTLHPLYIDQYLRIGEGMAYVPIRNPKDISDSWERRYGGATDKQADYMIAGLQIMVDCCLNTSNKIETFKIEELPVLQGVGPRPEGWDGGDQGRLKGIRDWIRGDAAVEAFYRNIYTDAELQWL